VKLKLLKMKKLVFTACVVGLGLTASLWAQVPSYVPKNGLVGWWPFNGNANDESGNGNNGTIVGSITPTADRFGNPNKSYSFSGNGHVQLPSINLPSFTINVWVKRLPKVSGSYNTIICKHYSASFTNSSYLLYSESYQDDFCTPNIYYTSTTNKPASIYATGSSWCDNNWHMITGVLNSSALKIYFDGVLINSASGAIAKSTNFPTLIGAAYSNSGVVGNQNFGQIDDVGFWNIALTQQEITALYKGCGDEITSQPTNANLSIGTDAQFSVGAKSGSSYQWQSNPLNLGWQNISNNSTYSGATSNKLTISSTSVSSHNQPFRAIVNSSGCIDTSIVAKIIIGDTCLSTVTDTLIINTTLSLPAPNNENTILIYPNPASDHITIDNGNFSAMAGYSIKITNNAGQQVFQSTINQQQFYVDLSTWSGNGLYSVHLIDPKNKTVTVRKIVLQ
jgi:hypothetical protein